jgi:hypothetical protein
MRIVIACILFAACTNSSTTPKTDAPGSGSACTGAVYDPCTDNTQCTSAMCHNYMSSALQVCTQACTAGDNTTCPLDSSGNHGTCNNMSNCKPAAANNCTR